MFVYEKTNTGNNVFGKTIYIKKGVNKMTVTLNEIEELRQENLRLKNDLHYANNALAMLKFKGINQVNYTQNDLKVVSENPPSVDVRNFYNKEGESTIEW